MLAWVVILFAVAICLGCVLSAASERLRAEKLSAELIHGVELYTSEDASAQERKKLESSTSPDLMEWLTEAFQLEQRNLSILALNEITGQGQLLRSRTGTLARGLARIPFLAGGAAALAVFALGGLSSLAVSQAVACIGGGMVCALITASQMRRARKHAKKYCSIAESLAKLVERRWKQLAAQAESV